MISLDDVTGPTDHANASAEGLGRGAASPDTNRDIDTEIDEHFQWLRSETLKTILITLSILMWLAIVPYLRHPDDFWPGWGAPSIALVIILVCYTIKDRSYHGSSSLLIFSLAALISARTFSGIGTADVTPFLYIPVVLIASTLQPMRVALLIAVLASATLLIDGFVVNTSLGIGSTAQILLAIWLTALVAWLTKRNLYVTLHWYWHSQQEATRNLEETRRHRGELAGALKQLADATYRLERMNYALNWARLDAEQARRAKAQFAAHVSHELRTPINLIVGFSDMMLNVPQAYGGARLPVPYQTDLQALHRSAQHLQGMIDDILDLSQLDAQEMPLLRESVMVATVLDDAVAAIRQLLERKGLSVKVDVAPDVQTAYLDPLRIRQVLLNLLSNASRHTTQGGITIRAWRERDNVVISVADTGAGINPREIPYLFEPFHRLAPSPTGVHEGWGLGLAICKQFIELHGGAMTVASEGIPGRGTTFTIKLPIHPLAVGPHPRSDAAPRTIERLRAPAPAMSLVVVDPDPHIVNLCRRYLAGYQIHGAANLNTAIELAEATGAHALLVNLSAGVTSGSWYQQCLSLAQQKQLRLIGCSMPSSQQLTQVLGLADFLVKPITREALLAAVRRANPQARIIAVIDDDLHMVRMLSRMLRSSSDRWRVVRAYDGQQGLALIRRVRPDIVLLDLLIPGGGGLSLLEAMRGDTALAEVSVIAISAQDIAEVIPTSSGRVITLVTGQELTINQTIRGVRALLDLLPPVGAAGPTDSAPTPARAPAGSAASG